MNHAELLEQIKQLSELIKKATDEMNGKQDISFFKTLIQQNAIDIYQKASLLGAQPVKPSDIRVIRQEELMMKEVPADMEEPVKPAYEKPTEIQKETPQPTETPQQEMQVPESVKPADVHKEAIITPDPVKTVPAPTAPPVPHAATPVNTPPKPKILQEVEDQELSLNDKLSKNKQPVINVADKSKGTPISDLVKFISIGKKFEFINGLFDGNSEAYRSALQTVQNAASYEEATEFLGSGITEAYSWDEQEELSAEFFALIKRRFSK